MVWVPRFVPLAFANRNEIAGFGLLSDISSVSVAVITMYLSLLAGGAARYMSSSR